MIEKIRFKIRYFKIKLYKLIWSISSKKDEKRYIENDIQSVYGILAQMTQEEWYLNRR